MEKSVMKSGNGARVCAPASWAGKLARITRAGEDGKTREIHEKRVKPHNKYSAIIYLPKGWLGERIKAELIN